MSGAPSFLRAIAAVLSAFIGIRKRRAAGDDFRGIRPLHVVIAGVLMVAVFVGALLIAVQLIV